MRRLVAAERRRFSGSCHRGRAPSERRRRIEAALSELHEAKRLLEQVRQPAGSPAAAGGGISAVPQGLQGMKRCTGGAGIEPPHYDHYSPRRRSVAQPGSAPEWGSGGRRFESSRSDHSQIFGIQKEIQSDFSGISRWVCQWCHMVTKGHCLTSASAKIVGQATCDGRRPRKILHRHLPQSYSRPKAE